MTQAMARRYGRFAERNAEPRSMTYVRRFSVTLLCTFALFAAISGYRAIVQVYRVDLRAPDSLRAGSIIRVGLTSSGRTNASGTVALIQGAHVETLAVHRMRDNHIGYFISTSLSPFPVHDSMSVMIPAEILARFASGPATLRAIGLGQSQWLRVPPPTVAERAVILVR